MQNVVFSLLQPYGKSVKYRGRLYYIPSKISVETQTDAEILRNFLNSSGISFQIATSSTNKRGRPSSVINKSALGTPTINPLIPPKGNFEIKDPNLIREPLVEETVKESKPESVFEKDNTNIVPDYKEEKFSSKKKN